jgi:ubiquinone/menaquinone biosynthesis C-methylase UbiE
MENSKSYFDTIADKWDTMQQSFFSTKVRDVAYDLAQLQEGKVAADIGAGTGFITEGLLKRKLNVFAIDQSQQMLEHLIEKYSGKGQFTCIQGDSNSLPLANESVDYVFANMYLHHVDSLLIAIKEMFRILKRNGKMVITDLDLHEHDFLRTEQHDKWLGFDREDIKKWFEEAGFSEVSIDCVGAECSSNPQCCCDSANISIFAALGVK